MPPPQATSCEVAEGQEMDMVTGIYNGDMLQSGMHGTIVALSVGLVFECYPVTAHSPLLLVSQDRSP